ncbi:MAG: helix-turn-helix transcriptional regulator [Clostridiales bacterium]|nr:helix-turn-helix transcriptional regulator [Clostridiales bacterium]
MKNEWTNTIITNISLALHVITNGVKYHTNRPNHGFVINNETSEKDYHFSDGSVMHTGPNEIFYLPKGSTYSIEEHKKGTCYAINFDANIEDEPFCIKLRNIESLLKSFKKACASWKSQSFLKTTYALRAVYDFIIQAQKELNKDYLSKESLGIIAPAVDIITTDFTNPNLSVSHLASICKISDVYFRKIFLNKFGISPKAYIIQRRIEYAKQLIESRQFSILEVAQSCGYEEQCHFSREFSKHVGLSPQEYKRQN